MENTDFATLETCWKCEDETQFACSSVYMCMHSLLAYTIMDTVKLKLFNGFLWKVPSASM